MNDMAKKLLVEQLHCIRCLHDWWPRIIKGKIRLPERCPKCNSPYWCRPRKQKK